MTFKVDDIKAREIAEYWNKQMPMMAMEEAGELIQALSKNERKPDEEKLYNLKEEIRDMIISISAVCKLLDISDEEVNSMIEEKTRRKIL